MPAKDDMLPIDVAADSSEGGTITYANEVIAIISGIAASEIDGIAGMVTSGGFGDIIGKNRNITRGVKVEVGTQEVSVDLFTMVEYGKPIQKVATQVQENVRKSIEAMTGLKVVRVDVHVQGVSFEKEKREVQSNLESANVPNLMGASKKKPAKAAKPEPAEEKAEEPKAEEKAEEPTPEQEKPDVKEVEEKPEAEQQKEPEPAPQPEPEAEKPAARKPAAKAPRKPRKS